MARGLLPESRRRGIAVKVIRDWFMFNDGFLGKSNITALFEFGFLAPGLALRFATSGVVGLVEDYSNPKIGYKV
jgi:hypothetical protein